jgi:3-methyladenine DNA glycosylase AlkD
MKPTDALDKRLKTTIEMLERLGTKKTRDGYPRYGIYVDKALGVTIADIQKVARLLGEDHELAGALWSTGWYEARLLASFVDEAGRVTAAQMDRWCRDFDNWGICDTVCFKLFDRSPQAWAKVAQWSGKRAEFEKRAAFALLASLAGHDKKAGDEPFLKSLPLIEEAATDERNFVKKGVSWALRGIGRRSAPLHAASLALARKLSDSTNPAARWVGKDAIRDLTKPAVMRKFTAQGKGKPK